MAQELELRAIDRAELHAFVRSVEAAFGSVPIEDELAYWCSMTEPDQTLAVFDGGRIVANAAWSAYDMTLPAGPGAPNPIMAVPGVTAVGVQPTHRRQGLLTRMMTRQLSDLRRRGHSLAILIAAESIIYGRFGYGLSQSFQAVAISSRRAAFRHAPARTGRMRLAEPEEAAKVLPDLHDRIRRLRPGELNRPQGWWDWHFRDVEPHRDGGGARFYAVHESERGESDGYVSYRYHYSWANGLPAHRAQVDDLFALTPEVHAALWRFVLDLDLVSEVTCGARPLDDPLRWLLADPRQLRTSNVGDFVWVRIIDIPRALAARGYGREDRLVLEVCGSDPDSAGRWVLDTGAVGGACRTARKADRTDVTLGLADLGAIYLGGVAPSVLATAGRVEEGRPGALARADAVFASPVAPFCSTDF